MIIKIEDRKIKEILEICAKEEVEFLARVLLRNPEVRKILWAAVGQKLPLIFAELELNGNPDVKGAVLNATMIGDIKPPSGGGGGSDPGSGDRDPSSGGGGGTDSGSGDRDPSSGGGGDKDKDKGGNKPKSKTKP